MVFELPAHTHLLDLLAHRNSKQTYLSVELQPPRSGSLSMHPSPLLVMSAPPAVGNSTRASTVHVLGWRYRDADILRQLGAATDGLVMGHVDAGGVPSQTPRPPP